MSPRSGRIIIWVLVALLVLVALAWPSLVNVVRKYLLLPWRNRDKTFPARRPMHPIDPSQLPAFASREYRHAARELAACGFVEAGHFQAAPSRAEGRTTTGQGTVSIWCHPVDGAWAQLIAVQVKRNDVT